MFRLFIRLLFVFFFFKQKTAYEVRISDWSSDVCSSDLLFGLSFSYTLPLTLSSSALQEVTPDRMRGFASAIYFVSSALIGMTVGPALVSMITDKMLGDPQKLGWSMEMVVAVDGASSLLCSFMALGGYRALLQATPSEPARANSRRLVGGGIWAGWRAGVDRPPHKCPPGKVEREE